MGLGAAPVGHNLKLPLSAPGLLRSLSAFSVTSLLPHPGRLLPPPRTLASCDYGVLCRAKPRVATSGVCQEAPAPSLRSSPLRRQLLFPRQVTEPGRPARQDAVQDQPDPHLCVCSPRTSPRASWERKDRRLRHNHFLSVCYTVALRQLFTRPVESLPHGFHILLQSQLWKRC